MDLQRLYRAVVFLVALIRDWGLDPKHLWEMVAAIIQAPDEASRTKAIKNLAAFFLEFFATRLRGESGEGIGMLAVQSRCDVDALVSAVYGSDSPGRETEAALKSQLAQIEKRIIVPAGFGIGSGAIVRAIARIAAPLALDLFELFYKQILDGILDGAAKGPLPGVQAAKLPEPSPPADDDPRGDDSDAPQGDSGSGDPPGESGSGDAPQGNAGTGVSEPITGEPEGTSPAGDAPQA